ncbi:MAG TPA: rod shape-determining protein MreD [Xanthomonadales bacterium]|nr:rod shape-determining protein MreD [Xanthomonadales bacterium]
MIRRSPAWLLAASATLAILLGMLALPDWLAPLRPFWLGLVLTYWLLEAPERTGLGLAFGLGLVADLSYGSLFGEHALRLCMLAFIVQRFRAQIRFHHPVQQSVGVLALLYNDRLIALVIRLVSGEGMPPPSYWYAPMVGALLWPLVFALHDNLRLRLR